MIYFFARRLELLADFINFDPSYSLGRDLRREIWGATTLSVPTVMLYVVVTLAGTGLVLAAVNWILGRTLRRRLPVLLFLPLMAAGSVGSWSILGFLPQALDVLYHASLPLATYVLLSFGETMLIMRTSMMDSLKEEYVNLARAKGLPERVVRDKHAARNALLPVFSRLIISLPYLLTGLVIIENEFGWPGMSGSLFSAMNNQDIPVVMGALLVVGVLSAVARLVLDVLYLYLDPRIRHGAGTSTRFG
jgi:peptide/nickel transport system permease protein